MFLSPDIFAQNVDTPEAVVAIEKQMEVKR